MTEIRLLDEVVDLDGFGIALFCMDEENAPLLYADLQLTDVQGKTHTVATISEGESVYTLHLPDGDAAYFERLFRNIRVDATLFTFELKDVSACP